MAFKYIKIFNRFRKYSKCLLILLMILFLKIDNNSKKGKSKIKDNLDLKICLCTLGKNENKYIREFVEYYKNYGVDKIFLYDNNDIQGERFEEVIEDYININYVKIFSSLLYMILEEFLLFYKKLWMTVIKKIQANMIGYYFLKSMNLYF